jgi:hypothetical protein
VASEPRLGLELISTYPAGVVMVLRFDDFVEREGLEVDAIQVALVTVVVLVRVLFVLPHHFNAVE